MEKMRPLSTSFVLLVTALSIAVWPLYTFSQNRPSAKGSFLKERRGSSKQSLFEKMQAHQVLGERIKSCQKYFIEKRGVHAEKSFLAKCVWEGVKSEDGSEVVTELSEEEKKQYFLDLGLNKKEGALKQDMKEKTYIGAEGVGVDKKNREPQDRALKALSNFLSKKLKDHFLKGLTEEQKKKGILIDHGSFNKIYQTRISKNIISSISSYCMNATAKGFLHFDPYKKHNKDLITGLRKKNLKRLNKFNESTKKNDAFVHWSKCLKEIKNICRQKGDYEFSSEEKKEEQLAEWYLRGTVDGNLKKNEEDFDYSSDTACLVNSTIKGLRRVLMKVKEIDKNYKDSGRGGKSFKDSGITVVEAKDLDGATSLTSGEFEESGFKEENEKMRKEFEENCNTNKATKECLNYVNIGKSKESEDAAFVEYKTKLDGLEQKLNKLDDEAVKKYLRENKYIDKNTEKLLTEDEIKKIKGEMKTEYEKEKKALISRMNRKIKGRTVQSTEGNQAEIDLEDSKETFEQIETGLRTRVDEYTQVIHFNNIVSGFLEITKMDDAVETEQERVKISNIRTIKREMKSMAKGTLYGPKDSEGEGRTAVRNERTPSEDEKPLEELEKRLKKSGGQQSSTESTELELSAEAISDKILQYKTIEDIKTKDDAEESPP